VRYRGVEYQVVQTIEGSFRWSVKLRGRERVGIYPRRDGAMDLAKKLIDQEHQKGTAAAIVRTQAVG